MQILVSLPGQTLELFDATGQLQRRYAVSTAKNGAGEQSGSFRTPRGRHLIRAKIGAGQSDNTVFVRRRPTGEIWSSELAVAHPGRDWILTRILWLSGLEPGFNRLGRVDTMHRYIYVHGSPDTVAMGTPGSIGCVRMRNQDIVELFDLVPCYTPVRLVEFAIESGSWNDLHNSALPLREAVFVAEQGVPIELEHDDLDDHAIHAVARDAKGASIGTGRLIRLDDRHARIGRMAVLANWRHQGVGAALLFRLMEIAASRNLMHLTLSAQVGAVAFYERYGFRVEGEAYLDAGIQHLTMRRQLTPGRFGS